MHIKRAETDNNHTAIATSAKVGKNCTISPDAIIKDGAVIGDNVVIEPAVIIYENVVIGSNSFIGAQCILGERLPEHRTDSNYKNPALTIGTDSTIRSGTIIYAGCQMGSNFQTGHRAIIRSDSIFGNNCSFGTLSQSDGQIKVGNNCRFHNNVFIATFTTVEDNASFFPMSCTTDSLHPPCQKGRLGPHVGKDAIIGACVLLLPRVKIGAGAVIAGGSVVTSDIAPNMVAAGSPAKAIKNKSEVRCHIEDRPAYEVALEPGD